MKTKIENFLRNLETEIDVFYLIDINNIVFNNAFDSIVDMIEETNGFDIEIFYYGTAMNYLRENDPSLKESLAIAYGYGFDAQNLNSEILASLLASKLAREDFYQLEDEINDFFAELEEEEEEEEEEKYPHLKNKIMETTTLRNVVGVRTRDWEVLKDGEVWTNGIKTEQKCFEEIEYLKALGVNGKWSYREYIVTTSIGKTVEL